MPENPLTDAMRRQLTPSENAESTSRPELCCASPVPVALSEVQQRLLSDLRACLPERVKEGGRITRIGTSAVLDLLEEVSGSPWRRLTAHRLAKLLAAFGVHPRAIRFGNSVFRGYAYSELRNAFFLHLPPDNPGDLLTHCLMRGPSV